MAHELMGSPTYALIILHGGVVDHGVCGYDLNRLIEEGVRIGRTGLNVEDDDIIIWESSEDMEQAAQVWHFQEGM